MLDLRQALADQADVEALVARRPRAASPEIHAENNAYGFAGVLKEYSGYPVDRPIQALVPTGVYLNAELMLHRERDSPVPAVLNYPAFRARVWEQNNKVVIPSASPFLYALELFRAANPDPPERAGSLFFPAHTVDRGRTDTDWGALAEEIAGLEDRFQPVTVCMYWEDHRKGLHREFERRGTPVVSAGYSFDPEFIYRWLHLVSQHRYVGSNDVGSSVYYATEAGVPVFLTRQIARHAGDPALFLHSLHEGAAQTLETKRRIAELFKGDPDRPADGLGETVSYLLGKENFKTPDELRADLERAASLAD